MAGLLKPFIKLLVLPVRPRKQRGMRRVIQGNPKLALGAALAAGVAVSEVAEQAATSAG